MNRRVAILDYDIGNVKSILNAFESIGTSAILTRTPDEMFSADALILPGVGAFSRGMENLRRYGLIDTIYRFSETKKPLLAICLGLQLLMEESEEFSLTKGLGLLRGKVVKLPLNTGCSDKIPHVSWNGIHEPRKGTWDQTIFSNIDDGSDVYFVHSFVVKPAAEDLILSTTCYGGLDFCSAVHKDNIYGCQFHPEKSGKVGLEILSNFVKLIKD